MNITEKLFSLQDEVYGDFQAKLVPGIERKSIIGIRVPALRTLAKECWQTPEAKEFIQRLPHSYYDENMFHGILLSEYKNYEECLAELNKFLPYVDNWAVCDIMSPKVFKKHKAELLPQIKLWIKSEAVYTSRFGMEMLMTHYLDKDFQSEYLELPAAIHSEEYYLQMMQAWFYATALAKQWDATIPYLEKHRLDTWVHNKTIQKAKESYRITPEQKLYLQTLKLSKH